jgi:hypothetical protein
MQLFIGPVVVSVLALVAVFFWGGIQALLLAALLSVLEVTLSFDNAVVNAKVLNQMSERWQKRFLTWGILFAVFGTRLVLPAVIVGFAAWISPIAVFSLAIDNPEEYSRLLSTATHVIASFGGAFLLMVSLKYFFDVGKHVHWLSIIESRLARWGRIEAIEIAIGLSTVLGLSYLSHAPQGPILAAGCIGILLFILIQGIANSLRMNEGQPVQVATHTSAVLFLYLNVLDAAFSLDGVVGAFALTTQLPIIFVGLGIGAYFVRSITVFLVRKKTLDALLYLEHGAHWAILGLALAMLIELVVDVPQVIVGFVGIIFVTLAYISSRRHLLRMRA